MPGRISTRRQSCTLSTQPLELIRICKSISLERILRCVLFTCVAEASAAFLESAWVTEKSRAHQQDRVAPELFKKAGMVSKVSPPPGITKASRRSPSGFCNARATAAEAAHMVPNRPENPGSAETSAPASRVKKPKSTLGAIAGSGSLTSGPDQAEWAMMGRWKSDRHTVKTLGTMVSNVLGKPAASGIRGLHEVTVATIELVVDVK